MPAQLLDLLAGLGPLPAHILRAIEEVPRHHFISEIFRDEAYKDSAPPIGHGAHASRPSTVVRMLSLLGKPRKVLEVGTGCGWKTALLSTFCEVHSIEINQGLHERAKRDLRGFNVNLYHGDGLKGIHDKAPFDGIIVCAAVKQVPPALLEQLSGVMVLPIGDETHQELFRITKDSSESFGPCGFMKVQ
jgi:protein-L-isoaspartate(D-aspartate) O-methyltransferase